MDAGQAYLSVKKDVNTVERDGFRASLLIAPDENLTITPRLVYQSVKMDGWNRIDIYNILANPFTTPRPKETLGDRQLFTRIYEPYTDQFLLGDLTFKYNFRGILLTPVTSYPRPDVDVRRATPSPAGRISR